MEASSGAKTLPNELIHEIIGNCIDSTIGYGKDLSYCQSLINLASTSHDFLDCVRRALMEREGRMMEELKTFTAPKSVQGFTSSCAPPRLRTVPLNDPPPFQKLFSGNPALERKIVEASDEEREKIFWSMTAEGPLNVGDHRPQMSQFVPCPCDHSKCWCCDKDCEVERHREWLWHDINQTSDVGDGLENIMSVCRETHSWSSFLCFEGDDSVLGCASVMHS